MPTTLEIATKVVHYKPSRLAFLLLPMLISACGGSESIAAANSPRQNLEPVYSAQKSPEVVFDGNAVTLANESSSSSQPVHIENSGAESAERTGPIDSDALQSGFRSGGDCRYSDSDVAASSGLWRFELSQACVMTQITDTRLEEGTAVSLVFDAMLDAGISSPQLNAEIIVEDADTGDVSLGSFVVPPRAAGTGWSPVQVSVSYGAGDEHIGGRIGVRFSSLHEDAHVGIDNIELSTHQGSNPSVNVFAENWDGLCNQQWAGEEYWSNRLVDWEVSGERLRTNAKTVSEFRPNRTTHRISTRMSSAPADFSIRLDTGLVDTFSSRAYSGILLGAGGRMDYRSSALVHNRHGENGGLIVAVDHNGRVFVMDHGVNKHRIAFGKASAGSRKEGVTLQVDGRIQPSGVYSINVYAFSVDGELLSSTQADVDAVKLLGNIAIVSNPGEGGATHWFDNWEGYGSKLLDMPSRQFGPVLFSSYTLSRGVLTVNAQYPPLCVEAIKDPELQVLSEGVWNSVASAEIDPQSYTARFMVDSQAWQTPTRYRIATNTESQGADEVRYYDGVVQPDPSKESEFVFGVFNCRPGVIASNVEGWIQQNSLSPFSWTRERIVFPHEQLLENSQLHQLDMVAFLGDQIYEFDPNGLIEKDPDLVVSDYLWKWFQFGWSAREIMRNTPSFILPDDHDIYQGNVWGQGGIAAVAPEDGGYVQSADFVNIVQRTQAGSLPDPSSSVPLEQGIKTYYTSIVYGGVGMAVLEDRKFKTGPNSSQSPPILLGADQHMFLESWAADWGGHSMKLAISQSPFSQSTTHSGQSFDLIGRDLDSNGWPKSGRDDAVRLLRKAYAPHIAGDQHLGMSLKHGIDAHDDAVYSFAGPSMLNIFPRIWDPINIADGPGDRSNEYEGQHTDVFGNFINVLAAANPDVYYKPVDTNSTPSKNELGIGYGIVRVNKPLRQYTFEAWPANVNPVKAPSAAYPGWPIVVDQVNNDGRVPSGYLLTRNASVSEPVVQVFDELDGALIYARKYPSSIVDLPVFDDEKRYRVVLSDPATGYREQFDQQMVQ